jgi:hypothetical protein
MVIPMRLIIASLLTALCCAAEPVAVVIDARIQKFEQAIDTAFKPVQTQLDGWRTKRAKTAMGEVSALLPKAGPRDRIYIAYQLLSADPKHRAAREVYTALGLVPPFDEQGKAVVGTRAPACDDLATVSKAVDLRYPPFDEVTKAVDLRGSVAGPFWKKLEAELLALRKDLAKIASERAAEQAGNAVYPLLAYYQPRAPEVQAYYAAIGRPVPAGRSWFNPVDRWLLDHELAGLDPLRAIGKNPPPPWPGSGSGELPAFVPGASVEVIAQWRSGARIELDGAKGPAVIWTWLNGKLIIVPGGAGAKPVETAIDVDLSAVAVPVRCMVRGRIASVAIGGIPVAEVELPQAVAVKRWIVTYLDQPRLLRVRYLAAAPELDLLGDGEVAAKAPAKPAEKPTAPAWLDERTRALLKPVTCNFADERLDEVAAALSSITGTTFRLAPSAEPLADLPVTMTAKDIPLRTALEWLRRLAELEAVPDEEGFRLEWKR